MRRRLPSPNVRPHSPMENHTSASTPLDWHVGTPPGLGTRSGVFKFLTNLFEFKHRKINQQLPISYVIKSTRLRLMELPCADSSAEARPLYPWMCMLAIGSQHFVIRMTNLFLCIGTTHSASKLFGIYPTSWDRCLRVSTHLNTIEEPVRTFSYS